MSWVTKRADELEVGMFMAPNLDTRAKDFYEIGEIYHWPSDGAVSVRTRGRVTIGYQLKADDVMRVLTGPSIALYGALATFDAALVQLRGQRAALMAEVEELEAATFGEDISDPEEQIER